jgi:hypothetical protein
MMLGAPGQPSISGGAEARPDIPLADVGADRMPSRGVGDVARLPARYSGTARKAAKPMPGPKLESALTLMMVERAFQRL